MFRSRALRLGLMLLTLFTMLALPVSAQNAGTTATATEQVFIRAEPQITAPILGELHTGDVVTLQGESSNGFVSIYRGEYIGWVSMDYLDFGESEPTDPTLPTTPEPTAVPVTPEPTAAPVVPTPVPTEEPVTSSSIVWPVSGGEWRILQGYNGSSHQNNSSLWQYRDSLDLVRTDGSTAGQTVYSPVTGTIRWLDPDSGGISIDLGNGYAVAMFHVVFDSSLAAGDAVGQGQALGYISAPGEAGYASTPHVHIALWQTSDGGNWSRTSTPFTGSLAISGYSLPNDGSSLQHTGIRFNP